MIERVADRDHLDLKAHEVLEVFRSINENMMSAESYPSQLSEATVVGAKRGDRIRIFVHYYLSSDAVGLLYAETDAVGPDNYQVMRDAAVDSVEAMGFLMENLNYRKCDGEDQARLLDEMPAFGGDRARVRIGGATTGSVAQDAPPDEEDPETVFILDDDDDLAPPATPSAPSGGGADGVDSTISLQPDTWKVLFRLIASL